MTATEPAVMRILQVGALETGGGAASVAGNLRRAYRSRGHQAWLAVGRKASNDPDVFTIPEMSRATGYLELQGTLGRLAERSPGKGWGSLRRSIRLATHPRALIAQARGIEDFEFPGTYAVLDVLPAQPDIVHAHNLHGGYFDLRALGWLSHRIPTVLTLHDAWLLSGHCAHSFDCQRWMTGCGECPDLDIYPAIRRDATAINWMRKQEIFRRSRLYVTTPSRWLMGMVERSMLAAHTQLASVIPNGIDRSIFKREDKETARRLLGIDTRAHMVFLTLGRRDSPWADHATLEAVIAKIAARRTERRVLVVVATEDRSLLRSVGAHVQRVAYQSDPLSLVHYFQAADVFLHCVRAGTFPTTILEAMACGTPVVASAVGGIPEQIRSAAARGPHANTAIDIDRATGMLVESGAADAMAAAVLTLFDNAPMRHRLGVNAAEDVRERFDLDRQVERYLGWYRTIIEHWTEHVCSRPQSTPAAAAG